MVHRVTFPWRDLPEALTIPLLKGGVGKLHLLHLAEAALGLAAADPHMAQFLVRFASDALFAAWEADPLEARTCTQMLALHESYPFLPKPVARVAALVAPQDQTPAETDELRAILTARDADATCRYLDRMHRRDPANTFWTRQALFVGMAEGRHEWLRRWLNDAQTLPAPLREGFLGDLALAGGEDATPHYEAALRGLPLLSWRVALGEARYRQGDREGALARWDEALARRAWQVNLLLRRHDVRHNIDLPAALPPGRGAVLLYTWNKADSLQLTLDSLFASDLGDTPVIVLDNGSTDATPEVLRHWQNQRGAQLHTVTLPCNIGAPAARNWLLCLPETRACDWLVFLDDDVEMPADWLRHFGAAMQHRPDHAIYGCRVVDHAVPAVLQSVDLHLDPGGPSGAANGSVPSYTRRFHVGDIHHQTLDYGQFSYQRPCVSVTGCCHLFRRSAIDTRGLFDVRYSPSQYDDLEHDIRHALAGELPLYHGHLRILHMKRSGRATMTSPHQLASAWANLYKLQMRYSADDYDAIRRAEHDALLADVVAKVEGQ